MKLTILLVIAVLIVGSAGRVLFESAFTGRLNGQRKGPATEYEVVAAGRSYGTANDKQAYIMRKKSDQPLYQPSTPQAPSSVQANPFSD